MDVVLLRGDWTRRNRVITQYLEQYQRYGIPFNMVYGPGLKEGYMLPELLTKEAVRSALDQAATAKPKQ